MGNIGSQLASSTPCSKGLNVKAAKISAITGALGGLTGNGLAGFTSSQALPIFTKFGQGIISSFTSGLGGGLLDFKLQ